MKQIEIKYLAQGHTHTGRSRARINSNIDGLVIMSPALFRYTSALLLFTANTSIFVVPCNNGNKIIMSKDLFYCRSARLTDEFSGPASLVGRTSSVVVLLILRIFIILGNL